MRSLFLICVVLFYAPFLETIAILPLAFGERVSQTSTILGVVLDR